MDFFIDSSIFLNLFLGAKEADKSEEILSNVEKGVDIGYVTPHILEEITYKLIVSKGIELLGKTSIWVLRDKLKSDEDFRREVNKVVRLFYNYIHKLTKGGLRITSLIDDDFFKSVEIIEKFGLLPSDALTVAVMMRKGIKTIASFDSDFKIIKNLHVIP